jgi:glycosyltransferase involved in cell wall biosynthesis
VGARRYGAFRAPEESVRRSGTASPAQTTSLPHNGTNAVTVGYHAPPPGSHSGVADYAETLRTALQRLGPVESAGAKADIHLYHLGNNRLHEDIYARALAVPGVVVLHDAVLHHFFLGTLSREQYISEWVYNYGEWRRDLGEELWREKARASVDPRYFQYPMLRRIVERSLSVIVHNPGASAIVRAQGARHVEIIPHFCEVDERSEADAADTARFRQRIGVEQGAGLFGMFGYLREPKRVIPCIRAFQRLHAARPATALLLAGEVVSGDLERLLQSEAQHPAIHRLGHLSERDFRIAGTTVDCCLNLRYPGVGESSGIAIRLMGLAKPVIVTDNAENSDFPLTAVLRVAPGVAEAEELFENMLLVTEFSGIAREIGSAARLHIQQHHSLETVARQYWKVLCAAASSAS